MKNERIKKELRAIIIVGNLALLANFLMITWISVSYFFFDISIQEVTNLTLLILFFTFFIMVSLYGTIRGPKIIEELFDSGEELNHEGKLRGLNVNLESEFKNLSEIKEIKNEIEESKDELEEIGKTKLT